MAAFIDLTGQRFGRLRVVRRMKRNARSNNAARWRCRCDCGGLAVVQSYNLQRGNTKSCGCLQREFVSKGTSHLKHGHTRNGVIPPEYKAWAEAKRRCTNPRVWNYRHYGGRGIRVCHGWNAPGGFMRFYKHIGPRPSGTSLDRIDVNGDYRPGNVRWATPLEQRHNRR